MGVSKNRAFEKSGVKLQCLTEANPRETTNVFWFEESGVSNNRVFEKLGFPCIPFHIPLESHQFCGPVITEALPMVHCGNAQIRQVREVRTFFGNFFQFAQTREHSFSFEFARHFLNVTHDELRIISSINVSNCQAIVTDYVKTCSEKLFLFACTTTIEIIVYVFQFLVNSFSYFHTLTKHYFVKKLDWFWQRSL